MTEALKKCSVCGLEKTLDNFALTRPSFPGRRPKCRECMSLYWKKMGEARKLKRIANGTNDAYLEGRKTITARYVKKNRAAVIATVQKYNQTNSLKLKAHRAVKNALKRGDISRAPCEVCGAIKTQAHHDDYSLPLAVRFLCHRHHKQWHAENGPGRNGADNQEIAA